MKWGDDLPAKHDMSSLRILGSVGEPINPEAWIWYHTHIGKEKCPIVDTYWQTETGGHVCTPLPGSHRHQARLVHAPDARDRRDDRQRAGSGDRANQGGLLVIRKPWPGMLRGVYGNREAASSPTTVGRSRTPRPASRTTSSGRWRRDDRRLLLDPGRIDDVIKVSGHLLGTMEVESALVSHPAVAEAAVVGVPHEIKGNAICAFVSLKSHWLKANNRTPDDTLKKELTAHVRKEVGALAQPDQIRFTDALPKTRSGKIMPAIAAGCGRGRREDHAGHHDAGGFLGGGEAARRTTSERFPLTAPIRATARPTASARPAPSS